MSHGALMAARTAGSVRRQQQHQPPPPQRGSSSSGPGGAGSGADGEEAELVEQLPPVLMELSPTVRMARQQQHHSGNWNVEVVRGKVTTQCFWNACKAFSCGLALMVIGTSMAVVGYYADQLSVGQELRGNLTVQFKNESRGFHLNNLSYVGPIIMGFGGFIVVAACVMTFEARDSAAKVVPARPKYSTAVPPEGAPAAPGPERTGSTVRSPSSSRRTSARRSAGVQTRGSRRHQGSQHDAEPNRRALTAAFVQFSRSLQRTACTPIGGLVADPPGSTAAGPTGVSSPPLNRSPSAPDLMGAAATARKAVQAAASSRGARTASRREAGPPTAVRGRPGLRPYPTLHRQALSVDCQELHGLGSISPPGLGFLNRQHSGQSAYSSRGSHDSMELGASACAASLASASNRGSQASMVMDLHLPNDWPVTLQVRDQSQPNQGAGGSSRAGSGGAGPPRRSDTARRHMLTRQRPVLDDADGKGSTPARTRTAGLGAGRSLEDAVEPAPLPSPVGSPRAGSPRGGSPRGAPRPPLGPLAGPLAGASNVLARMSRHASMDVHTPPRSPTQSPRSRSVVRRSASPASRIIEARSSSPRLVRYADEDASPAASPVASLAPSLVPSPARARAGSGGAATFKGRHRKLRACRSTADDGAITPAPPAYTSVPSVAACCACAAAACPDCQPPAVLGHGGHGGHGGQQPASRRQSSKSSASSRRTSRQNSANAALEPQEGPAATATANGTARAGRSASKSPAASKPRSAVIDMAQVEAQLRNQQDELHRALEAHKRRREERLQQMMQQPAADATAASSTAPPPPPSADAAAAATTATPAAAADGASPVGAAPAALPASSPPGDTCTIDLSEVVADVEPTPT